MVCAPPRRAEHPVNMALPLAATVMPATVHSSETSIVTSLEQPLNMLAMFFTSAVLNADKSSAVSPEQFWNMPLVFVTLAVSKVDKTIMLAAVQP